MTTTTDISAFRDPATNARVDVHTTIADLRRVLKPARAAERAVGLVPTMGALHEGHLSLVRAARAECDVVVVSVFVNPTQFAPGEDLDRYPRRLERDIDLAAAAGADIVFAPDVDEIYPDGPGATMVSVAGLGEVLCGDPKHRGSAHFAGVAGVVAKLFNIVSPDRAYFGQKDAQQVAVIDRMSRDLNIPVGVVVCPTVREPDGLAMSSRNAYLSRRERIEARSLYRALSSIEAAFRNGERDCARLTELARPLLTRVAVEYLEIVDAATLRPLHHVNAPALAVVAARVGTTRLIDNLRLEIQPPYLAPDPQGATR